MSHVLVPFLSFYVVCFSSFLSNMLFRRHGKSTFTNCIPSPCFSFSIHFLCFHFLSFPFLKIIAILCFAFLSFCFPVFSCLVYSDALANWRGSHNHCRLCFCVSMNICGWKAFGKFILNICRTWQPFSNKYLYDLPSKMNNNREPTPGSCGANHAMQLQLVWNAPLLHLNRPRTRGRLTRKSPQTLAP